MNFETMTNQAVAAELGRRIEQLRLENNLTQQAVADEIGISRISYGRLEAGEAKLINVIATLRVLGQLLLLEQSLPDRMFSPMELLKLQGKQRKRASGKRLENTEEAKAAPNEDLDW
ncbi:MAG: helix-turn-helix transcriptional regulator [Marinicella sp.]